MRRPSSTVAGSCAGVAGALVLTGSATALSRRIRAGDSVKRPARRPCCRDRALGAPAGLAAVRGRRPHAVRHAQRRLLPHRHRADGAQIAAVRLAISIKGLVDTPVQLTYDELLAMDSVEETVTLPCVSNEVGGHLVGNAVWQGVPLAALLDRAGVQSGADAGGRPLGRRLHRRLPARRRTDGRTALVAYAMNGEPLPADHGYPARLVVAGLYGYVSATKWLTEIELTTWDDVRRLLDARGWSQEAPIKTQSRIDVPSRRRPRRRPPADRGCGLGADPGHREGRGAGRRGRLAAGRARRRWRATTRGCSGSSRGTPAGRPPMRPGDRRRRLTQTDEVAPPAPDGATGWHTRRIRVHRT